MPQLVPLTLEVGEDTLTFTPTSNRNNKAILVDIESRSLVADQQMISAEVNTATATSGSRFRGVVKSPIPVVDQAGCCIDKNSPSAIYINIDVVGSNYASSEQRTNALALFRAWAASDAFAALFNGESYY